MHRAVIAETGYYFFLIRILSRIEVTFQPLPIRRAWIKGSSCRILAAAALPLTSRHQVSPSMGPAWTAGRKASGSSGSMALSLSLDSWTSSVSRAREGEFPAAW
jgi:hypothetical protein